MKPVTALAVLLAACCLVACQSKPAERPGLVTLKGKPVTLMGTYPQNGDKAPPFTAVANDLSTYQFQPGSGRVYILASVPSLDTPVCSAETRHFNEQASQISGVKIVVVSMDLPFAQKRWCGAEGVKNLQTVSDSRDRAFGDAYGVRIKENGLLARTVFVVGKDGRIAYAQIVPELADEPDYEAALQAARTAAGQ